MVTFRFAAICNRYLQIGDDVYTRVGTCRVKAIPLACWGRGGGRAVFIRYVILNTEVALGFFGVRIFDKVKKKIASNSFVCKM